MVTQHEQGTPTLQHLPQGLGQPALKDTVSLPQSCDSGVLFLYTRKYGVQLHNHLSLGCQ